MTTIQNYINSSLIQDYVENLELALHPEMLHAVLDHLDITWISEILKQNPSSKAGYHNNKHTTSVILNTYEGGVVEKVSNLKTLVVAAAFHDFNHAGLVDHDHVNIPNAIAGLEYYASQYLTSSELQEISILIESTYYPYKSEPENVEQQILRDADLMQIYERDDTELLAIYSGLKEEIEATKNIEISFSQFIEMNKKFHSKVSWYTQWAKTKSNNFPFQCQKLYQALGKTE